MGDDWRTIHQKLHSKGFSDEGLRVLNSDVTSVDLAPVLKCVQEWSSRSSDNKSITARPLEDGASQVSAIIGRLVPRGFCKELVGLMHNAKSGIGSRWNKHTQGRETLAFDCPPLAQYILEQAQSSGVLPKHFWLNHDYWRVTGLSTGCRIVRYPPATANLPPAQHTWHYDEVVIRDLDHVSAATLMIYLDDQYEGGNLVYRANTTQKSERFVALQEGDGVIVGYDLYHRGDKVLAGSKHILRVDVELERASISPSSSTSQSSIEALENYHRARYMRARGEFEEADKSLARAFELSPALKALRRAPTYTTNN